MNKLATALFVLLLIAVGALGYIADNKSRFLGYSEPYIFSDATNTSSSVPTLATTTSPVLSADPARTNAMVCNISSSTVFLHPKGQSTTTGVVLNEGITLYANGLTTTTAACLQLPGFKGYLFGISSATSTVTVSSWK